MPPFKNYNSNRINIYHNIPGSTDAWKNLAAMYHIGDGVPKSEETAKEIMRVMFSNNPEK